MLPRTSRLHSPAEFKRTYGQGVSVVGRHMVVYGLIEEGAKTRLGLSVSRKVGGAAVRNRIRRRLSGAFLSLAETLPEGARTIIVARPRITQVNYQNMEAELNGLLNKLSVALNQGGRR